MREAYVNTHGRVMHVLGFGYFIRISRSLCIMYVKNFPVHPQPTHYTHYDIGGSKGMVVGKRKPPKGARTGVGRRRESPEGGGAQACAPRREGEVVTCRAVRIALTGLTASRLY